MNNKELLEREHARVFKAQSDIANAEGLYAIYRAHLEIRPCEANDQIITKYFNGDAINIADFDQGWQYESVRKQLGLALWSESEKRDALEKQIMKLLPTMSEDAKQNLHHQFQAKMPQSMLGAFDEVAGSWLVKTESMELQLRNLQTGKKYEGFTTQQLTEEVKAKRTIVGDFAPLPSNVTKWQVRLWDVATLKKMMVKHGVQAINEVLARPD